MRLSRGDRRAIKRVQAMEASARERALQTANPEGITYEVAMESLLDGHRISTSSISGLSNEYTTYSSQVRETYYKYNGKSAVGNDQLRVVVDLRSAFIAGENFAVIPDSGMKEAHRKFFDLFLESNKLHSFRFFNLVKQTEMTGYAIAVIKKGNEKEEFIPRFGVVPNGKGKTYHQPILSDPFDMYSVKGFNAVEEGVPSKVSLPNFVYIRTGGDGSCADEPTTKVGVILTECENYDRAIRDIRLLNHKMARITPSFQTATKRETSDLMANLRKHRWRIGDIFAGTAKMDYKVPGTGAHSNLKIELEANAKTISGVTGVPVHWMGQVDLMSNRATAEELYNQVNTATSIERSVYQCALKELLIKAQGVYIDSGGSLIKELFSDFRVNIPLMDFGRFASMVKAFSTVYDDGVISRQTYQGFIPGVDPLFEIRQLQKEEKEAQKWDKVSKTDINFGDEEEDNGLNNDEGRTKG